MPEPTTPAVTYTAVAAELHRIANAIAAIDPTGLAGPSVRLYVSTDAADRPEDDAIKVATVDALALALLGEEHRANTRKMSSGSWHHGTESGAVTGGLVQIFVFDGVTDPTKAEVYAEVARLRAELAAARTKLAAAYHPAVGKQTQGTATAAFPHIY